MAHTPPVGGGSPVQRTSSRHMSKKFQNPFENFPVSLQPRIRARSMGNWTHSDLCMVKLSLLYPKARMTWDLISCRVLPKSCQDVDSYGQLWRSLFVTSKVPPSMSMHSSEPAQTKIRAISRAPQVPTESKQGKGFHLQPSIRPGQPPSPPGPHPPRHPPRRLPTLAVLPGCTLAPALPPLPFAAAGAVRLPCTM